MQSERLWLSVVCMMTTMGCVRCYSHSDLKTHLSTTFTDYSTRVRPVTTQENAVSVTLDLFLVGINDFDSSEQKLETTAYLEIGWTDQVLQSKWANAGIDSILVTQSSIWVPDLALQNSIESMTGLGNNGLNVRVLKAGTVSWRPYQVFESSCAVDVTFFPFDKTTCELKFVIWNHPLSHVSVAKGTSGLNIDSYEENSEWSITSTSAVNFNSSSNSGVNFSINLKRKPLFYLLNIILPVIMLAFLNAFVFALPISSGERTGLAVTAFLAFAVFLTIVSAELPQNSEKLSMFAAYVFIMTFVSSLISIITIIQIRLADRAIEQPIPGCLISVTRFVRRMGCDCTCRKKKGYIRGIAVSDLKRKLAEEISWGDTVDSLDFVFFWLFFFIIIAVTAFCLVISILGSL